jgi:hypothetical protein
MLQDPFSVNKYINNLSYLDKMQLSFIKNFLLNRLIDKNSLIDLSSSFSNTDLLSEEKKESVLLIGNASSKNNYNSLIDNFDGDVIRFNRFKTDYQYKLGKKTSHWIISKNFATDKSIYENELEESLIKNFDKYKKLDVFVSSYPLLTNFNHPSIKVLNTNECFKIYQKMCQLYIKLNGFLMPYDDDFIKTYGAFKPSTGVLTILNSIISYKYVKVVNFDGFRSNHYWKENSKVKQNKYQTANNVIGYHQPVFERSIINTLFRNKYIDIIK